MVGVVALEMITLVPMQLVVISPSNRLCIDFAAACVRIMLHELLLLMLLLLLLPLLCCCRLYCLCRSCAVCAGAAN